MNEKDILKKEELLLKNLKDTDEIFNKHKITYWLDWGTLLGAIRDKKIIDWDDDLDFSTLSTSWKDVNSILGDFEQKGFDILNVTKIELSEGFFHESVILSRFGYDIDLYFYQLKNETFFHSMLKMSSLTSRGLNFVSYLFSDKTLSSTPTMSWKIVSKVRSCLFFIPKKLKRFLSFKINALLKRFYDFNLVIVPAHYFETLDKIKFYGMEFNIPSNSEDYLKSKYGKSWKIPNDSFNKEGLADYEGILKLY